jgi:hypothetical protein
LMNYILLRADLPPIVIKSKEKSAYLRALNRADAGDFEAFVGYITEQLCWSMELCLKAAKGESLEEAEDLDKELELLNRKLKGKEKIKTPSRIEIENTFQNLVIPSFQLVNDRIEKISSFYLNSKITVSLSTPGKIVDRIAMPSVIGALSDTEFESILAFNTKLPFAEFEQKNAAFAHRLAIGAEMIYYAELKALKSSSKGVDHDVKLSFKFRDYNIELSARANSTTKVFDYGTTFQDTDIVAYINMVIRRLMADIEDATKA